MHIRPRSIRTKLLAVFVLAAVLPMGVLGYVFYWSSTRTVADMAGHRAVRIAHHVRAELDAKLAERISDRLLVANQPVQDFLTNAIASGAPPGGPTLDALRRYLGQLFGDYASCYDELILADRSGRPLLRYDRESGAYLPGRPSTAYPVEPPAAGPASDRGATSFGGPALAPAAPGIRDADRAALRSAVDIPDGGYRLYADASEVGSAPSVSIVRPVRSVEAPHERIGYLLSRVRSQYLWPPGLSSRRFGQQGHLVVVDAKSGEILYHTRRAWIGRRLDQLDPALDRTVLPPNAAAADSDRWLAVRGEGGGGRVEATVAAVHAPWRIIATAVPGEFASEARRAGLLDLIVASLALLAAATVLVVASGRLSRSIKSLTAGARRIAGGDYAGPPILPETHDEIETLAHSFNAMAESVRGNIAMREQAVSELDALNRSLESRVRERTHELLSLNEALNRANEELKELDKLKSNFLATVSHEFKTPLTSIKAFAEILHDELEERNVSEELRRFLRIIDSESDRLARLIKNVLDLSRIESGQMLWRMADFPVSGLIEATVDGLLPALKEKRITVERRLECGEARLHGDADRIQEVIANVLDNAIKASPEGRSIVIGCHEEPGRRNGQPRMLRLSIRDHGPGIPADQLNRIFDRFHQVGAHGSRRKGGTGLGLAISREITEHHGGRIWAESEPGHGSTFHISLPLATAGPSASGPAPEPRGGAPGDSPHV